MMGGGNAWQPGQKLKLLFAGYNGTRNTGSDVRVEEMLRQIAAYPGRGQSRLQRDDAEFRASEGYFRDTHQVLLPDIFPPFLADEVPQASRRSGVRRLDVQKQVRQRADHHDDRLARHRRGAKQDLRRIRRRGWAHGPLVAKMCAHYCKDSLIITRNEESRSLLRD